MFKYVIGHYLMSTFWWNLETQTGKVKSNKRLNVDSAALLSKGSHSTTALCLFVGKYAPELTTKEFLQCLWEGTSIPHRQAQMTFWPWCEREKRNEQKRTVNRNTMESWHDIMCEDYFHGLMAWFHRAQQCTCDIVLVWPQLSFMSTEAFQRHLAMRFSHLSKISLSFFL